MLCFVWSHDNLFVWSHDKLFCWSHDLLYLFIATYVVCLSMCILVLSWVGIVACPLWIKGGAGSCTVCVVVVVVSVVRLTQLCVWCLHSPGEGSTKEAIASTGNSKIFDVSALSALSALKTSHQIDVMKEMK